MIDFIKRKLQQLSGKAASPVPNGIAADAEAGISLREPHAPPAKDLTDLLAQVLEASGRGVTRIDDHLLLANGLRLECAFVERSERENGGFRVSTSVKVVHEDFFPGGLTEYQHSVGQEVEALLHSGFHGWQQVDLVVLEDAVQDGVEACMAMEMTFPERDTAPARSRRVLMGPTVRCSSQQAMAPESEEHPFCACCLFRHAMEPLTEYVDADDFYGIRLFAARDLDGVISADCRINGEDFPAGVEALKEYVRSWADQGFEFRKQYIVICNKISKTSEGEHAT